MAEKIVDGLISQHICLPTQTSYLDEKYRAQSIETLKFNDVGKKELAEAISEAIVDNLTYGNLGTMTLRDNKGRIVAKLYILPDGTLSDDSWTTHGIKFSEEIKRQLKESHIRTHPDNKPKV